jgi:hypothetical protein
MEDRPEHRSGALARTVIDRMATMAKRCEEASDSDGIG